jgi:hypothetical protein
VLASPWVLDLGVVGGVALSIGEDGSLTVFLEGMAMDACLVVVSDVARVGRVVRGYVRVGKDVVAKKIEQHAKGCVVMMIG